MTLEQAADRIGKSKAWLSKVERGLLPLDKRSDIAALAEVLEVSADSLTGHPVPEIRARAPLVSLAPLRAVLLDATLHDPPDIPARPVAVLALAVTAVDRALRRADYAAMHRELPGLLGELQVQAATAGGGEREEALRLLIGACASATIMLKHEGRTDLAWISADRARLAAVLLGEPAWTGAALFGCAHAGSSPGKSRALLSAGREADRLEGLAGDDVFPWEVTGMLRLTAALACAVQGDHAGAAVQAAEAAEIAARTGGRPEAFEAFGPPNAGVWRTSLAVEAGNAEEALDYAAAVDVRALAAVSANRRAALGMEKARALVMLGKDAEAVRELRHAERLSPQQVHHTPLIRELVTGVLVRAGGPDLRGLAWRMGVI